MVQELDFKNYETEGPAAGGVVVVDFFSNFCEPCVRMEPVLDRLAQRFAQADEGGGRRAVRFCKMNADRNKLVREHCGVEEYPSFALFRDGIQVGLLAGEQDEEAFAATIAQIARA